MVFPDADGAFGSVLSVIVWGNKLKIDVFGPHELLEGSRALVVEFLEAGFETAIGKVGV
jgi:hypothetical protein